MTRYSGPTEHPRRLYTAEQIAASREAWEAGRFSDEWRVWRHLAAMEAGIIEPPDGTAMDSWSDDHPSQRAILIRAIRETPQLLRAAITTTRRPSWSGVIEVLLRHRDEVARDIEQEERDAAAEQKQWPDQRQATYRLKEIMQIVGDS